MIQVLPIIAAIFWALHYVLFERLLENVSMATFTLISAVIGFSLAFAIASVEGDPISFSPFADNKIILLMVVLMITQVIATLATNYAIKFVSATYAAIGEVSYPLFIPVFGFVLFGWRQWNTDILIGGSLIMVGVYILVHGQFKLTPPG